MKAKLNYASWYVFALGWLVLFGSSMAHKYVEEHFAIYAPVSQVHITRGKDFIIWTGVSKKLRACSVTPGSPITLTGYWKDELGQINPLAYSAKRPSGSIVNGDPIIRKGDEFVVGPWIIYDAPNIVARMVMVSQFMHCKFPSGVERFGEIGPIMLD